MTHQYKIRVICPFTIKSLFKIHVCLPILSSWYDDYLTSFFHAQDWFPSGSALLCLHAVFGSVPLTVSLSINSMFG